MKLNKIAMIIIFPFFGFAQDVTLLEPLMLVDTPTAGTLMRGSFRTQLRVYNKGGILGEINVGITDRFTFGISYGGTNLVGTGSIDWNPQVGANVRYRLFEEGFSNPAIVIGFDSQGYGAYIDSTSRYLQKSRGLFAACSKNFYFLGTIGLHGGVNYSFEKNDKDKDINFFVGLEKSINPELAIVAEYDFAINDNDHQAIGENRGLLNAGVKWTFAGKLQFDFLVKDIRKNRKGFDGLSREIHITYVEIF